MYSALCTCQICTLVDLVMVCFENADFVVASLPACSSWSCNDRFFFPVGFAG